MTIEDCNPENISNIFQIPENGQMFNIGSYYYFHNFEDFIVKDYDYLIVCKGDTYEYGSESAMYADVFGLIYNQNETPEQIIQRILDDVENNNTRTYMALTFLNGEVMNYIGITIEDVKPYFERIRKIIEERKYKKHTYYLKILDYIIQNNSFELTQQQLENVYQCYKDNYTNRDKLLRRVICFTVDENGNAHRITN